MKDLRKIYIDLSKCSEEQQNHIISLLPKPTLLIQYQYDVHNYILYFDNEDSQWWIEGDIAPVDKTELTYPDFIKLFEGGEETTAQLKADKAELLEALETVLHNSDVPNEIYDQSKSLIKKHKP